MMPAHTPTPPKSRSRCGALAALLVAVLGACSSADRTPDPGEQDTSCGSARSVGAGDGSCDTGRGGPMKSIPTPAGGTMCIDLTEVTVASYQQFLADANKPPVPSSDPSYARCSAKDSYAPSCLNDPSQTWTADYPQVCVDQCDAMAFCRWAGKRLCGQIGGGPVAVADAADPTKNQWVNACYSGGRDWPYGPSYDSQACNTIDRQPKACGWIAPTGSYPGCQAPDGPYAGVLDLSGNAYEWLDACDEQTGWCVITGGSYVQWWGDASCIGSQLNWPWDAHIDEFGFRCCSIG